MTKIYESDVEEMMIEMLESQEYTYLSPEMQEEERGDLGEVILKKRLRNAIEKLNPQLPIEAREEAFKQICNLNGNAENLVETNEVFHRMLTEGITVEYQKNGDTIGGIAQLVDFDNPTANELVVTNQFTVHQGNNIKRPDVVILVNGLPLIVVELKNPVDENATVKKAWQQLQTYKNTIPNLFFYNEILIASDGIDAKTGSLTAGWSRFMNWKTVDGIKEDPNTTPQIDTLTRGMLRPEIILDLIRQFTVFEKTKKEDPETGQIRIETIKKIAAYHQYHAVNAAVQSTLRASAESTLSIRQEPESYNLPSVKTQSKGDRRAGVVWHTQGSGKSLSMVFYAGKIVLAMDNPTIVVITDRNDLDDQLFDTFASCKQLLRQDPIQAKSRSELKDLLKTAGGGIVFTTIQKFYPEDGSSEYELLSERNNIIVIADEAHRSQYGFGAKTRETEKGVETRYGNAKYLRDAIPNASFIGFTGTPIEKEDKSTIAVFGNYIDIYDIEQAVEDKATVRIYYESRLAKIHLKEEEKEELDEEVEAIVEGEETSAAEKAKAKWAQLEAIVGHKERLKTVAEDFIRHFETRRETFDGKAMFVTMSRRIAVELYEAIITLKPEWHDDDLKKGRIKIIMTSTSSDPLDWQKHHTSKQDRKALGERLKDPSDPLEIVIVRDMWLTGFDAPCVKTMYIDKPMRGHNLMQAIARVNRIYNDIEGGLIVDYIGIASDLKRALASYTESGGEGKPTFDQEEAVATMLEKYEIVSQMFNGFDYERYFKANTHEKMTIILEAQEHILGLDDGKNRFTKEATLLSKTFALSVPHFAAMKIKEAVGFFQVIKARLNKFEPTGSGRSDEEMETSIRQLVDKAVVSDGVIDIFDAAGIKKPDISILDDRFLEEVRGMKQKNLALELLKKILNDEIKGRARKNLIQSKKFSEMLENAIKKYQNNLITAVEVIEELIKLAKDVRKADEDAKNSGLTDYEIAFYDALANNDSAKEVLGNDILRDLARVLVERVKSNASIDWTKKESVQAKLRSIVKRTLRTYGYPPDMAKLATENILKQAELLADEWSINK
jgi:type I restriction enzyme R subunit